MEDSNITNHDSKPSPHKVGSLGIKPLFTKIAIVIIAVYLIIWIASPMIAHYFIGEFLKTEYQLELTESSNIRYNPFLSHLTIRDLSVLKNKQIVFELEKLDIELRLHQLIANNIFTSEFNLDGLSVSVINTSDQLEVAGVNITKLIADNTAEASQTSEQQQQTTLELILPNISISNTIINLDFHGNIHQINLNYLKVIESRLSYPKQTMKFSVDADIDGAPLKLSIDLNLDDGIGGIDSSLTINELQLARFVQYLPEQIETFTGQLNLETVAKIAVANDVTTINSPMLELELENYRIKSVDFNLEQQSRNLNVQTIQISLNNNIFHNININTVILSGGMLEASGFGFTNKSQNQKLTLNNIALSQMTDKSLKSQIDQIEIDISDLEVTKQELVIDNQTIELILDDIHFQTAIDNPFEFDARANLAITDFSSHTNDKTHVLAQIKKIRLDNFYINKTSSMLIEFDKLIFAENQFSSIQNIDELPELASMDSITFDSVALKDKQLGINEIIIDGLSGNVYVGKDKNIKNLVALNLLAFEREIIEAEKRSINEQPTNNSESDNISQLPLISIKKVEMVNSKTINLLDESISPVYNSQVVIDTFFIENIDANFPEKESAFTFKGHSDQYTKFNIKGYIKPFSKKVNLMVDGALTEVALPPINSYLQESMDLTINSGELDVSPEITINDSIINGRMKLNIRGLDLGTNQNYDARTIKTETVLPLNTALSMLKDSEGNVELDIPMHGDIDSPNFGFGGFIGLITTKAIQIATKRYVLKTFLPYAELLSVAMSAGSFIFKTRFEDLPYQPKQTDLSEQQMVYVNQFIKLMHDQSNTQVKVCSVATLSELPSDDPELQNQEQKISYLEKLSTLRMEKFKAYVVEQKIKSSRILLCKPKVILDKKGVPKIIITV